MEQKNQVATTSVKQQLITALEKKIDGYRKAGELHLPVDYSAQNALKSAWLIIQKTEDRNHKPALEVCTRESIANALLNTVVLGLNPGKKQVYYVVYGNELVAMPSYFGTMAIVKRIKGVVDVFAQVVYEGDEFEFEISQAAKKITLHKQKLENIDITKITAAYCTIFYRREGEEEITEYSEVMTWKQIQTSWTRSKVGIGRAHKEQPEEMAKRTVIARASKMFVNVSNDSDLVVNAINAEDDIEPQAPVTEIIDMDDYTDDPIEEEAPKTEKKAGAKSTKSTKSGRDFENHMGNADEDQQQVDVDDIKLDF